MDKEQNKTLSLNPKNPAATLGRMRPVVSGKRDNVVVIERLKPRRVPQSRKQRPPAKKETKKETENSTDSNTIERPNDKAAAIKAFEKQEEIRKQEIRKQEEIEQRKRKEEEEKQLKKKEEEANIQKQNLEQEPPKNTAEIETTSEPIKAVDNKKGKTEGLKSRSASPNKAEKKQKRDLESRPDVRNQSKRRQRVKINVDQEMSDEVRQRSHAAYLRSQERKKRKSEDETYVQEKIVRDVQLPESITVQELANRMAERVSAVLKTLMKNGVVVSQNQTIDADTAELIISEFGHKTVRVAASDVEDVIDTKEDSPDELLPRPAVVSVMGHVDHGKTSLLDAIRKTKVAAGEAGGITQHIGAYQVEIEDGQKLTFIDTPGHAAFTAMRARGAQVTDIVILVVAADDAVMPQSIEAINHAQAANVPIIVAINKMDVPGANPSKVRNDLLRHNVIVEAHSGDVLDVEISAVNGTGIDKLLEAIALQAEILELKSNPDRQAIGTVIESSLDSGRGSVATILVRKGTLRLGDIFVVGNHWGKVRALVNDAGDRIVSAGPSMPVEVIGLNGTPLAGDVLNVVDNESQAKEISQYRQSISKVKRLASGVPISLEQLMKMHKGEKGTEVRNLQLVIKADVQGSMEAIVQAVEKIGNDEVRVRVLHSGVGAITETDISLAEASDAQIIGFNVRANASARQVALQKEIDIRYYSVIYALVDDIRSIASNLLSAEIKETFIGSAEILEVFKITGSGMVAGCLVKEGIVRRSMGVRLLRDSIVVHEGTLKSLKRFKDEVNEVVSGQECGMSFENYSNIRKGDFIEVFKREEIQRSL